MRERFFRAKIRESEAPAELNAVLDRYGSAGASPSRWVAVNGRTKIYLVCFLSPFFFSLFKTVCTELRVIRSFVLEFSSTLIVM